MVEFSDRAWAGRKYINDVNAERCYACPPEKQKNCAEHYKAIVVDGVTLRTNCLTTEELSVLNKIIER